MVNISMITTLKKGVEAQILPSSRMDGMPSVVPATMGKLNEGHRVQNVVMILGLHQ